MDEKMLAEASTTSISRAEQPQGLEENRFTKASIGENVVLALAPLSVLPEYQGKGIGTALILEGHRIAKNLRYMYSIVLGSETFYPRVGYIPAEHFGIKAPFDVPSENFMACRLNEPSPKIQGMVKYAKEFGIEG